MTVWKSNCGMMELRLGDYREVLADVEADHCITDPPYSERTHGAYREMPSLGRRAITYGAFSGDDVIQFVADWNVPGWLVAMTDHTLIPSWERAALGAGRYAFAPLAAVEPGQRVRLVGDGPAQWSVFIMASRPKTRQMQRWGALRGAYVVPYGHTRRGAGETGVIGGKPIWLMRAIVRDYSRPGDLIVDPCAGGGTTLLAAAIEGRRAIGAEIDPETYHKAVERLSRPYTPVVRFEALTGTQGEML